jgi:hypothetical protein
VPATKATTTAAAASAAGSSSSSRGGGLQLALPHARLPLVHGRRDIGGHGGGRRARLRQRGLRSDARVARRSSCCGRGRCSDGSLRLANGGGVCRRGVRRLGR